MNYSLFDHVKVMQREFRTCQSKTNKKRYFGGPTPSTGFVAALMLKPVCKQVNLYGFGPPARIKGKIPKYQYYQLQGKMLEYDMTAMT